MKLRWYLLTIAMITAGGCGDADDDVAEVKTPLALDKVPAAVMKAAREAAPELTFYAAAHGKFQGQDAIELKGKTKSGQIKELEMSPEGKLLGTE